VSEFAKDDEEDDKAGNPAVELVCVNNFVAKERNKEGTSCDNDNAGPAWNITVDGIEDLRAYDNIDRGPAYAGENIKEGNCGGL
jgi:hypothetical protein